MKESVKIVCKWIVETIMPQVGMTRILPQLGIIQITPLTGARWLVDASSLLCSLEDADIIGEVLDSGENKGRLA